MTTRDQIYVLNAFVIENNFLKRFSIERHVHYLKTVEKIIENDVFRFSNTIHSVHDRLQTLIVVTKMIERKSKKQKNFD